MQRRYFLGTGVFLLSLGSSVLAPPVAAHTPYRQWQVYRRKHLLIGCHKQDMEGYALAKQLTERLEHHLPEARARVARGPTAGRLASLLGTEQMDVALLSDTDALAMSRGTNGFEAYGAVPLRSLLRLPERVLVARTDFPDRHAWLVVDALTSTHPHPTGEDGAQPLVVANGEADSPPLAWHDGALRHRQGLPVPKE